MYQKIQCALNLNLRCTYCTFKRDCWNKNCSLIKIFIFTSEKHLVNFNLFQKAFFFSVWRKLLRNADEFQNLLTDLFRGLLVMVLGLRGFGLNDCVRVKGQAEIGQVLLNSLCGIPLSHATLTLLFLVSSWLFLTRLRFLLYPNFCRRRNLCNFGIFLLDNHFHSNEKV